MFERQFGGQPMGENEKRALGLCFDRHIKLEFHDANISSDAGLLAYRELDEVLGLTTLGGDEAEFKYNSPWIHLANTDKMVLNRPRRSRARVKWEMSDYRSIGQVPDHSPGWCVS